MATIDPKFSKSVPEGDDFARNVCDTCGYVAYENPKIVVGSVVKHKGLYLLCRRAIEPRSNFWTVPAGYLELNETPEQGAKREAMEEACATLELHGQLALYSVPHISQVQIIYRATLIGDHFAAGPESLDVQLFGYDDIPWDELAFPTVRWMLKHDRMVDEGKGNAPFVNPEANF